MSKGALVEKIHKMAEAEEGVTANLSFGDSTHASSESETLEGVIKPLFESLSAKLAKVDLSSLEDHIVGLSEQFDHLSDLILDEVGEASEDEDEEKEDQPGPEKPATDESAEKHTPTTSGQVSQENPVVRAREDGTPCAINVRGEIFLSSDGFEELLAVNRSTVHRWLNKSGLGVRLRPEGGTPRVFADPEYVIPWAAKNSQAGKAKKLMGNGSIQEVLQQYLKYGAAYRAPDKPVKKAKKKAAKKESIKPLTNNSSAKEVIQAAEAAGCRVNTKPKTAIKIHHESWPAPFALSKSADHCPPNLFNRINKLLSK